MEKYGYTFETEEEAKEHDQPWVGEAKTEKPKKELVGEKKDVLELDTEGL